MARLTSARATLLVPLVLLIGAATAQVDANSAADPPAQTRPHVGAVVAPPAFDLVEIRGGPDYPIRSRMFREVGTVTINVWLTETGAVTSTAIARSSGYARLDEAAVRYIRQNWHYTPRNKAAPMPEAVQAEVIFRLD